MFSAQKDLNSEIKILVTGGGRLVAAGAGDNTEVTGNTIDRYGASGKQRYASAVVSINCRAVLAASKKLQIGLKLQESSDGSSWDTAEVVYAATDVLVDSGSGSTLTGNKVTGLDLSSRKRYIRFNHTPDLDASGTDTAEVIGTVTLGGGHTLPAT